MPGRRSGHAAPPQTVECADGLRQPACPEEAYEILSTIKGAVVLGGCGYLKLAGRKIDTAIDLSNGLLLRKIYPPPPPRINISRNITTTFLPGVFNTLDLDIR